MGGREQLPSIESEERSPPHRRTKEAAALRALVHGPLSSSITSLLSHSRAIPGGKDFHFYNNFDDFRIPVREFSSKSLDLLSTVASSSSSSALSGQNSLSSLPADDLDDAYDWLVNLNDELAERFGAAMDEFAVSRREIEAGVDEGSKAQEDDGFQLVRGKNKKKRNGCGGDKTSGGVIEGGSLEVKVAQRDTKTKKVRPKVPFHMPHVPRPQDEYSILVNNANQPFQHVWLETNEDGSRFVHPLEKLSVNDFIDWNIGQCAPIKPRPLEDTPFKLVEGVKELKELASKLQDATEFAVDLEHNQYRSFQGLTCLMQISTRNEDFVVDTLKLRIHIGPHLREVFKDPHKRKIMHGADRDILWLQRDFGIYVCNLFDTGQSSRVLQLERNSLEYLLHHFCDVSAKKEYQSADWRLRPLPNEMIKYAREDTHYLLYLYDIMRVQLLSKPSSDSANDSAIIEVYKRSYDICIQLYEKELLTDRSYLYVYGLREADLNSQQLAVVAGLFEWRDSVARAEDESTGYILPNRILLEIARQMPLTSNKLRWLVRPKHPVVERYLGSIVSIIRSSIQNAAAFESVVEELKRAQLETLSKINNQPICAETESLQACEDLGNEIIPQVVNMDNVVAPTTESAACYSDGGGVNMLRNIKDDEIKATLPDNFSGERVLLTSSLEHGYSGGLCKTSVINVQHMDCGNIASSDSVKVNSASVRVSKKSTGFGALFGNSKKKPNFEPRTKYADQETAEARLEQINSSVSLPFRSFSGLSLETKVDDKQNRPEKEESQIHHVDVSNTSYESEDIISLDNETHAEPTQIDNVDDDVADRSAAAVEPDTKDEPLSLAEMSLSFQKCLESKDLSTAADSCKKLRNSKSSVKFEPFNYDAAVKQMNFMGDAGGDTVGTSNTASRSFLGGQKGSVNAVKGIEQGSNFQQPRRRQAFPPSGNRSGTFR